MKDFSTREVIMFAIMNGMDRKPLLLFINGPVAIGKSTIAKRYVDDHVLSLLLNADDLVGAMGRWLEHEDAAKELAFSYAKTIATEHLKSGYDVVMPYLLIKPSEAEAIEELTHAAGAVFVECVLVSSQEEAFARALERGTWGEPGSPPLTEQDIPILEHLYDGFMRALPERPNAIQITAPKDDIEATYTALMEQITKKLSS